MCKHVCGTIPSNGSSGFKERAFYILIGTALPYSLLIGTEKSFPTLPPAACTGKCSLPLTSPGLLPGERAPPLQLPSLQGSVRTEQRAMQKPLSPGEAIGAGMCQVIYAQQFAIRRAKFPFCWLCRPPAVPRTRDLSEPQFLYLPSGYNDTKLPTLRAGVSKIEICL